jgi:GxxExxY protein
VHKHAMQVELLARGFKTDIEREFRVNDKGVEVDLLKANLWVSDCVIVELKVAKAYVSDDEPQVLNELKATAVKVGLLINFGRTKVEFKRMVF